MSPVPPRSFRDFATRRIVLEKVVDRRLGHESIDPPPAWRWDYRYVVEDKITETLPFPGLKRSHLLGLPRSYWQNGPITGRDGDALEVTEVKEVFAQGRIRWLPVVHNGDLNIWRDPTFFFSDDSVIERLSADSIDSGGRSLQVLQKIPRPGSPILATIFRRDRENEYLPWRFYTRREAFSGVLDSDGVEQTTRDGDTFYWSNVDTTKREFVSYVREEQIYCLFNQFAVEAVTSLDTPSILSDFNDLEYLGTSDGSDSQRMESSRFPVSNDSGLAVYVVNVSGSTWTQYSVVSEFTGANQVILDEDLGIFEFGVSGGDSEPPADGLAIYLAYRVTPRIEYEEDGYSEESVIADADVSPLAQSLNKGFITLGRSELDVASIVLETTKEAYPGIANTFGPVSAGADYAPLLATVYSSTGEVVPNVEVTFFFVTDPPFGGLGGSGESTQRRTGLGGIARTYYVPPASVENMGYYVTSVNPDEGEGNYLALPADANLKEEQDIYTYHVLKDDPSLGIAGADTARGEVEWSSTDLNGRKVIFYVWNSTAINPISGNLGAYAPVQPSSITDGYILNYTDTLEDPDTDSVGVSLVTGAIDIANTSKSRIKGASVSWDINEWKSYVVQSDSLGERRRILSNTQDTLVLVGEFSEIPTGNYTIYNKTDNLGAYWVVSDRSIVIRASVYSPKQRRTIYSNILNLRVEIPDYMKGTYVSDSLNAQIPFGWRLIDDTYDQASAIDGATYISINPVAGPYPIIDVIGGETWEPYSGSVDMDPYPFWPYGAYPSEGASAPFAHFSIVWNSIS